MRLPRLLLLLACLGGWPPAAPAATDAELRVMSFNVRLPLASDGENRWEARRERLIGTLRDAEPDVIGTQELYPEQAEAIVAALPEYRWFGRGRRGGREGDEHMGVFYRHAALRVIESGDFWLSDTPDVPGSISWGHLFPRMVSWALFERSADGRRFYLYNTHLPYRDEDAAARLRGVETILARLAELPGAVPLVLSGDFNATPDSPEYARLAGALDDAWTTAAVRHGPAATFHAFSGKAERRIDWIFVRGFVVRSAHTLDTADAGRYPSDHFPVLAVLAWPESP